MSYYTVHKTKNRTTDIGHPVAFLLYIFIAAIAVKTAKPY